MAAGLPPPAQTVNTSGAVPDDSSVRSVVWYCVVSAMVRLMSSPVFSS